MARLCCPERRSRRSSVDPDRPLLLTDVGDDVVDLLRRESLDRWHRPEVPVVLRDATLDGQSEGRVGVVAGLVDLVEVRRAEVGAPQVGAVAPRAVVGVELGAGTRIPDGGVG